MSTAKVKKHSDVVELMKSYYIDMCGFKVFTPNVKDGVFAVAHKESNRVITLLDDKAIVKTDSYGKNLEFISVDELERERNDRFDIESMSSQDE